MGQVAGDAVASKPPGVLVRQHFVRPVSLAEFERSLIAERVKAGMQRAKAQGKHTGRPALPSLTRSKIEELLRQQPPLSLRAIARTVGVGVQTVANVRGGQ
jgi:DNA invertase Pin-like site-specific DNA recombinase